MQTTLPRVLPLLIALVAVASPRCARCDAPSAARDDEKEKQKIERLISDVESLKDAVFIRNGTEFDAKKAAEHMRTKWKAAGSKIKTARDFIRLAASKSSVSGKPYLIRFKDGREVESETFLSERLDKLEKPSAK